MATVPKAAVAWTGTNEASPEQGDAAAVQALTAGLTADDFGIPEVVATTPVEPHLASGTSTPGQPKFTDEDRKRASSVDQVFLPSLKQEQYVPVRVARDAVKQILAKMAAMKQAHFTALEVMEKKSDESRQKLQHTVVAYTKKLKADYDARAAAMDADYKGKLETMHVSALQGLQQNVEQAKLEIKKLEDESMGRLAQRDQELYNEKKSYQKKIDAERRVLADQRDVVTKGQEKLRQYEQRMQQVEERARAAEAKAAKEVQEAQRQCHERLEEMEEHIEALQMEYDNNTGETEEQHQAALAAAVEEAAAAHQQELAQLNQQHEDEVAELKKKLKALKAKYTEAQNEAAEKQSAMEKMKEEVDDVKAHPPGPSAEEVSRIQAETAAKNAEQMEALRGQLMAQLAEGEQRLATLTAELDQERQAKAELEEQLLKGGGGASADVMSALKEKEAELEARIGEREDEIKQREVELATQLEDIQEKLTSAESERDRLRATLLDSLSPEEAEALRAEVARGDKVLQRIKDEHHRQEEEAHRAIQEATEAIHGLERDLEIREEELKNVKDDSRREAEAAQLKLSLMDDQRTQLRAQIEEAKKKHGRNSDMVRELEGTLQSKNKEIDDLAAERRKIQAERLQREKETAERLSKLEKDLAARETDMRRRKAEQARVQRSHNDELLKAEKESAEKANTVLASTNPELAAQLQAQNSAVIRMRAEHDASKGEEVALVDENNALEAQVAMKRRNSINMKVAAIAAEEQALEAQRTSVDPNMLKELEELREEVEELRAENARTKADAEESKASNANAEVLAITEKLDAEKRKTEEVQAKLRAAQGSIASLDEELSTAKSEASDLEAKLKELKHAVGDIGQLRDDNKRLKKEAVEAAATAKEAVEKWKGEAVLRKKYFNEIQDLKGKIRVMVRARPLNSREKANNSEIILDFPDEYSVKCEKKNKDFQFDATHDMSSSQDEVWESSKHFAQSAIDGYNCCIFAYGQTGSGKTFTMEGPDDMPGLTPRFIKEVYALLNDMKSHYDFTVSVYMLELYNDGLYDLLVDKSKKGEAPRLDIKKDAKGMIFVAGSVVESAPTPEDLRETYVRGCKNRHVRSTGMNDASSRSHLVMSVLIETVQKASGKVSTGKLSLVDLAGSERLDKTGIKDAEGIKEAKSINKSLTALCDVIAALASSADFVPYRNNKLTLLMSDSLGGNAKTMMIANVSPASFNMDETLNTLAYASRTKQITNDAHKNVESKEIARLKAIIAKLKGGGGLAEPIAGMVEADEFAAHPPEAEESD